LKHYLSHKLPIHRSMSDSEADLVEKIIYTSFFVPLVLSGVLVWFIVFYQRKRNEALLREKDLIIKRQNALQAERTRIASEMHDDLGGGLTTIKFLSQKLLRKIDGNQNKNQAQKIVTQAQDLVSNMSEIIWAMNAGFDTVESLIAYVRHFAFDYLEDFDIELKFKTNGDANGIPLTGEKRRNIFLVVKEAIHNIVKHAECSNVEIDILVNVDSLKILITDNGVGMSNSDFSLGNGMKNMNNRIESMNGELKIVNQEGTCIELVVPLNIEET